MPVIVVTADPNGAEKGRRRDRIVEGRRRRRIGAVIDNGGRRRGRAGRRNRRVGRRWLGGAIDDIGPATGEKRGRAGKEEGEAQVHDYLTILEAALFKN
jgi:hypothetical protein